MKYRINKDFMIKSTQDFLVILSLDQELAYFSNDVGSLVWQMLQDGKEEEEIITRILEEYEVEREQVVLDLKKFLQALEDNGIIEKVNG